MLANRLSLNCRRGNGAGLSLPTAYPSLAAWYDVSDRSSLLNNAGSAPANGDGIKLIADKSGNSGTNVLIVNGVAGNYASTPDAAFWPTGDIDIRGYAAWDDWTPAASQIFISKDNVAAQRSFVFYVNAATGVLGLNFTSDGSTLRTALSTVAPTVSDLGWLGVRVTRVSATGTVQFFTRADASISSDTGWTQLGTDVASTAGGIYDGTTAVEIGAFSAAGLYSTGKIGRLIFKSSVGGTTVFDANFALASKLATSFTESSSNAATVTINSSGDLGARISGERDYFDRTSTKQPLYSLSARSVTGDGTDDFMRTAQFSLPSGWTRYSVIKQKTWTLNDVLLGGANGANSGSLAQTGTTPNLSINAGSSAAANTGLAVDTLAVVTEVFNGASSALRINRGAATTGDAGTTAPNGLTLFADGASTAANFGHGEICEQAVFSTAHSTAQQDDQIVGMGARWGISV